MNMNFEFHYFSLFGISPIVAQYIERISFSLIFTRAPSSEKNWRFCTNIVLLLQPSVSLYLFESAQLSSRTALYIRLSGMAPFLSIRATYRCCEASPSDISVVLHAPCTAVPLFFLRTIDNSQFSVRFPSLPPIDTFRLL